MTDSFTVSSESVFSACNRAVLTAGSETPCRVEATESHTVLSTSVSSAFVRAASATGD